MELAPTTRIPLDQAIDAVERVTRALIAAVGSSRSRRDDRAVGEWRGSDVVAHLAHVSELDAAATRGECGTWLDRRHAPMPQRVEEVALMTSALLDDERERDPQVLAERIEAAAASLVDTCGDEDRAVPWLLGATLPRSAVCSHLVSEMLLHGWDLARSNGDAWTIPRDLALVAIEGFWLPLLPAASLEPRPARWRPGSTEVRLRGGGRFVVRVEDDGPVVSDSADGVDLYLSTDARTMLLAMSGRGSSRIKRLATGSMTAWGRHPIRGARALGRLRAP